MAIKKLMVVGDSLSRGVIFDPEKQRYAYSEHSYVQTLAKKQDLKIENYSRFGATVHWGWEALKKKIGLSSSEAVLVEFGGNDCDYDWAEVAATPEAPHFPFTPVKEFCDTLCKMAAKVKQAGKKLFFINLPPIDAQAYFRSFTKGNREMGDKVLRWLGCVDRIYWWHEMYSIAVQTVAQACDAILINVRGEFLAKGDFRKYICIDGIHPNDAGYGLISQTVAAALAVV